MSVGTPTYHLSFLVPHSTTPTHQLSSLYAATLSTMLSPFSFRTGSLRSRSKNSALRIVSERSSPWPRLRICQLTNDRTGRPLEIQIKEAVSQSLHSFIVQDAQQQESRPKAGQTPKEAATTQENLASAGTREATTGHHQRSNTVGDQEYICRWRDRKA
jgi:hypothetical protein